MTVVRKTVRLRPEVREPRRLWVPSRRARQLALGLWIERQIEAGRLENYAHAARVLGVSRARVAQVVDLLLAPVAEQERWLGPIVSAVRDDGDHAVE